MKKTVLLVFLAFNFLTSCSNDSGENPNTVLVKKIVSTSNGQSTTTNFSYNGNKLDEMTNGTYKFVYTYSGDNIVNFKRYYFQSLDVETIFKYDNEGRINNELDKYYSSNLSENIVYTYNADNTISFQAYSGDLNSQQNEGRAGKIYNDANGETYKIETYYQGNLTSKNEWTYDTKNNPFKNIVGFKKQPMIFGKYFNILTAVSFDENSVMISNSTFEYTYDSKNFPLTCSQKLNDNNNLTKYYY